MPVSGLICTENQTRDHVNYPDHPDGVSQPCSGRQAWKPEPWNKYPKDMHT